MQLKIKIRIERMISNMKTKQDVEKAFSSILKKSYNKEAHEYFFALFHKAGKAGSLPVYDLKHPSVSQFLTKNKPYILGSWVLGL